jgi:hypothetical protein
MPARGLAEVLRRHRVDREAGRGEAVILRILIIAFWLLVFAALMVSFTIAGFYA